MEFLVANDAIRVAACAKVSSCKMGDETIKIVNQMQTVYTATTKFKNSIEIVLVGIANFDIGDPWEAPAHVGSKDGTHGGPEVGVDDLLAKWNLWRSQLGQEYDGTSVRFPKFNVLFFPHFSPMLPMS